jgi:hypothetical protein
VHKVQTLKNYKTTREAIDDADDFNDVGDATEFLQQRKQDRDL